MALVFISVGYIEPSDAAFDLGQFPLVFRSHISQLLSIIGALCSMTKEYFGYSTFGYWEFFNTEEAAKLLENHVSTVSVMGGYQFNAKYSIQPESVTSLLYPANPEIWKSHLGPVGAAEAWISSNTSAPRPAWLTAEEATKHEEVITKKGYTGPLNWYGIA